MLLVAVPVSGAEPVTCASCHKAEAELVAGSVHGTPLLGCQAFRNNDLEVHIEIATHMALDLGHATAADRKPKRK